MRGNYFTGQMLGVCRYLTFGWSRSFESMTAFTIAKVEVLYPAARLPFISPLCRWKAGERGRDIYAHRQSCEKTLYNIHRCLRARESSVASSESYGDEPTFCSSGCRASTPMNWLSALTVSDSEVREAGPHSRERCNSIQKAMLGQGTSGRWAY